jgi:HD-GYP domain-containing protein (c-di-GMP phosphodiesterase class II)
MTIKLILDQVLMHLNIDAADILLLKRDEQSLEFITGQGFRTATIYETHLPFGEGLAWQVVLNRQRISYHVGEDIPGISFSGLLEKESFESYIGLPLIVKEKVKGVLEIFHRSQLNLDKEWIDFLEILADQAAIAISNTELYTDLQRSNEELAQAYEATIEGWSQALELRDKETKGHSERVTHLACDMAIEVGYMAEELVHFRRGVLLHDVGKMGIPDSILLKPGPLDPEEWVIMRQHPIYAWQLLEGIHYLQQALDIPYYHHEKWDGSGYPLGLEGEEIPLSARIFAIIDVWDALNSDRPYRPAWPKEEVLEYIRQQSGKHFDPQLVELFLRMMKDRL